MHRLSPQDASFLHLEDDVNHMHIGSVCIFEGPAPRYDEMLDLYRAKLPLVTRYRQRVLTVPLDLGRPVWVDDPNFRLEYHVRHTALPAPGSEAQLRALASRVMSQQLDRSKPLWECWVVEGLEDGHWAMINKLHHCMVDGISGTDLATVIMEKAREKRPQPLDDFEPRPLPSPVALAVDAVRDALTPYEQLRRARAAITRPQRLARTAYDTARGLLAMRGLVRPASESSLTGPIGPHRRWGWADAEFADVKTVRKAFGGTVNDVVLAAITRGFRDLLIAHGEDPAQATIRSLVPVSVRTANAAMTYENKVSAMFAKLPVGETDPVARLAAIRSQLDGLKESKQAVAASVLVGLSDFAPPLLLALGTRAATRAARQFGASVNTVTTNVPGPQTPLYAAGREMLAYYPYVPLATPSRTGVAIFSYAGRLTFGVTADFDTVPDVEVLCAGIETGMAEMVKAAREKS